MNKKKLLKIVNGLMALDFILIVTTAILHDLLIPAGLYQSLHALPGFIFAGLVLIHVVLNWSWIKNQYLKKK